MKFLMVVKYSGSLMDTERSGWVLLNAVVSVRSQVNSPSSLPKMIRHFLRWKGSPACPR